MNSFANAAKIVSLANCPNLGLEIDAFDVIAVGVSMENLEAVFPPADILGPAFRFYVPGNRINRRAGRYHRTFPCFSRRWAHNTELSQFVIKLEEIGYFGDFSFDVYNRDYLQMPSEEIAAQARCAPDQLGETVLRRTFPVPNMERLGTAAAD